MKWIIAAAVTFLHLAEAIKEKDRILILHSSSYYELF